MEKKNNELSKMAAEMGRKGGNTTKSRKPADYYRKLGKYAMAIRWGKAKQT